MRVSVEVTGTITGKLSLDPQEFVGMDEGQTFAVIHNMLRAAHPGANFIAEDMADAVHAVLAARG